MKNLSERYVMLQSVILAIYLLVLFVFHASMSRPLIKLSNYYRILVPSPTYFFNLSPSYSIRKIIWSMIFEP